MDPAGLVESAAVRRILLILLSISVIAAAAGTASAGRRSLSYRLPTDAIEGLSFTVEHRVQTRALELPPEAESYDTAGLMADLADVRTSVQGRMERTVARVFRDESLGLVTRLVDLQGSVDRGTGAHPAVLQGLEGKSVSMRMLGSGELLGSLGWEHLAGATRGGDLVRDVLLMSMLRLPYAVPSGPGSIPTTFRMRVPVDPLLNLDQRWTMAWTAAVAPPDCKRCSALSWTATMTEAAVDGHPARPMDSAATGQGQGTIVLGPRAALVAHDFVIVWTRTVRSLRENDTRRAEIEQVHTITGRVDGGAR